MFTRAQLLERVWGTEYYDDHVVDVHVANLRHKLGDDAAQAELVQTVRGVGYRFSPPTRSHVPETLTILAKAALVNGGRAWAGSCSWLSRW